MLKGEAASDFQTLNSVGWLMGKSFLFLEIVGRIITLLPKAGSQGFLLLCKLQCCFCHLPRASCQLLWKALFRFKAGVEGRWSDSGSFLSGEHFVPSAVKKPLYRQVFIPEAEELETSIRHLPILDHFPHPLYFVLLKFVQTMSFPQKALRPFSK